MCELEDFVKQPVRFEFFIPALGEFFGGFEVPVLLVLGGKMNE